MVGSIIAARASRKAGKVQASAFSGAADLQYKQYKTTRRDLAPYRETGYDALGALSDLFLPGEGEGGDAPDFSAFYESPGYNFRFDEGVRALDRSASAKGRLMSGGHERELTRYGQGFASGEYNNYVNRLAALAGIGQTATTQTGQFGADAARAQGQFIGNAGTARASGYVGTANALLEGQRNFEDRNMQLAAIGGGVAGGMASGGMFSSRSLKENGRPVEIGAILDAIRALPVEHWNYIGDDRERLGPYAEDFKSLFGVGDGERIDNIDAFGVLFATVKGLAHKIAELEAEREAA